MSSTRSATRSAATGSAATGSAATRSAAILLGGSLLLAGCATGAAGGTASTQGQSGTPTHTVTVTVTVTPSSSGPASRTAAVPAAPASRATPDARPIPATPQAYTQDFVAAWVRRDRARAERLGTADAVQEAFAHRLASAPRLAGCEGAMGSSYCTFDGSGFTVIVRVLNEAASLAQPHAVIEVRYSTG